MTSVEILTIRISFIIMITTIILYGIFKSVRESRKKRFINEVCELIDFEFFNRDMISVSVLIEAQDRALLRIKTIFEHIGVKVEIVDDKFCPSIDDLRSLTFVKKYLPEIDKQLEIHKESERVCDEINPWKKKNEILNSIKDSTSVDKWRHLNFEQKREMIHNMSKEYDLQRKHEEVSQENLRTY